jgi:hypothetical protein
MYFFVGTNGKLGGAGNQGLAEDLWGEILSVKISLYFGLCLFQRTSDVVTGSDTVAT